MKVSIIVPALNAERTIAYCIESLMAQDFPKDQFEIIIVDNNSSDSTKNIIGKFPVRYVLEKSRGASAARNKGISLAQGELVAFIDSDCFVDSFWLKNMAAGFTDSEVGACGCSLKVYQPKTILENYFCQDQDSSTVFMQEELLFPYLFTGACIYRRKAIDEAGNFDTLFKADEDVDLSFRVYLKGYQIKNVKQAVAYHKYPPSLFLNVKRWFRYGVYLPYLKEKYKHVFQNSGINFPGFFDELNRQWRHLKAFFRAIFSGGGKLAVVTPLVKSIRDISLISGIIYGLIKLMLKKEKFIFVENPDRLLYRQIGNKIVVSNPKRSFYFVLEGISANIWRLLKEGKTREQIIENMHQEYDVEINQLRDDVDIFIKKLNKEGIIPG